jgi:integrase
MAQRSEPQAAQDGTITAIILRHKPPRKQLHALKAFIADYGSLEPKQLEPANVAAVVAGWSERHARATVSTYAHNLKTWLRRLRHYGVHAACVKAVPKQEWRQPRNVTITPSELDAVLSAADPALRLFVLLCHDCALRSLAATTVSRREWDEANEQLTFVAKGGEPVVIPVTDRVRAELVKLTHPTRPFIQQLMPRSHTSSPKLLREQIFKRWMRLKRDLGLRPELRMHDMRRTMARNIFEVSGKDIRVAQAMLGHASPLTTWRYLQSHVKAASVRDHQAAAAGYRGKK